jgi:hypothetical protein
VREGEKVELFLCRAFSDLTVVKTPRSRAGLPLCRLFEAGLDVIGVG